MSESLPPPNGPAAGPPPPAPAPAPAAGWSAGRALAGLGILIAIVVVEAGIVAAIDPEIESLAAKLTLQVLLAATMAGVAIAIVSRDNTGSPLAALGLRRPLGPAIGPAITAYLAYIGCALVIAALIAPEQEDVTRELGADEGTLGTIVAGVLIIAAAPLSEEIFFRGFMFAGVRRSAGFVVGALVSSVVWGLFHYTGPDSWGVCLQLALFGLALCWLYQRTGSIWPPIALHIFNNALAFTILTTS